MWGKKIGNLTVIYSTEGTLSVGYNHRCDLAKLISDPFAYISQPANSDLDLSLK
jgi:hypothetical protein